MDRERRIEARAYDIWEREGRPEGRHHAHWDRAAREIDAADGGRSGAGIADGAGEPDTAGKPGRRRAAAAIAAEDAGTAPKTARGRRTTAPAG
jgi:hypothetical protein